MPTGVFASYIPWVLYFIIAGSSNVSFELAVVVAFIAELIFGFHYLSKKFILDWCTLIYFGLLSILFFTPLRAFLEAHTYLLSNIVLALIMWVSIVIRIPFSIQYAKEDTPEMVWGTPLFRKINYYISTVWALALTLMVIVTYLQLYQGLISTTISIVIQILALVSALRFTQQFPDWYQGFLFRKYSAKREDLTKNFYLQGNYAPIRAEIDCVDLEVIGVIPEELHGVYLRNGPNPAFDPISYTYPVDGDGMIHAVYLLHGKASYRNKFVETKGYLAEKRVGYALYGGVARPIPVDPKLIGKDGDPGPVKNGAFIHVLAHGNQIMAMSEASPAYEITRDLKTVGEWVPSNAEAPFPVNAHTRLDPDTRDLYVFTYDFQPPFLKYSVINKFGQLIKERPIAKADSSMNHDFVLTKNYLIFFDGPAIFDLKGLASGDNLLQWRPERKMQIRIIHRKTDQMTVIEEDAYFVFHFANGFEEDDQIIIDYIRHESLSLGVALETKRPPQLYRATIDLFNKTIDHKLLLNYTAEFPRINEDYISKKYRYIYLPCKQLTESKKPFNRLIKFDLFENNFKQHDFSETAEIGEPIFIAKKDSDIEDEGYVAFFAYILAENRSEFILLNAQAIEAEPIARIKLPSRVPHGLHGMWLAE